MHFKRGTVHAQLMRSQRRNFHDLPG